MQTNPQNFDLYLLQFRGACHIFFAAIIFSVSVSITGYGSEMTRSRIRNDSNTDFERVTVEFPSQRESYGFIAKGTASGYRNVKTAYSYAFIEVFADKTQLVIQPIDYVGEAALGSGAFTYVLDIENGRLLLALVKD